MRIRALAVAAVVVALAACGGTTNQPSSSGGSSGAPEKANLTIAVGGQNQIIYMPLTLTQSLGYFKDAGLNVTIVDAKGGAAAEAAMLGGSADATCGFYEHTIRLQQQGKKIEMTTLFDEYPGLVMIVGKQHASEVKSIKDLKGHPVGITSHGSSTDEMVSYLEVKAGMKNGDVPTVETGTGSTQVAAIKSGQVWGVVTVEPAASQILDAGEGSVLYDTRTPEGTKQVFGGSWPAGGFYMLNSFAKENPKTVQALANAGYRTLKYISSHSAQEIADHLPDSFFPGGDKAAFVKVLAVNLKMFSQDGTMPSDGPKNVLDTIKAASPDTDWSNINLAQTYDNSFAQKAKQQAK